MIRGLWRRLRELFRPHQVDREAVAELTHHFEMAVEQRVAAGLDESEARRQARIEIGSVAAVREQLADERSGVELGQLARETAYAARVLRRLPGVTVLSIASMAAGIGASGVLFTLVNSIMLRPLPYPQPHQLIRIFDTNPQAGIDRTGVATGNLAEWRRRLTVFDGLAGYYVMGRTVSLDTGAEALITAQVTTDFFKVMGVSPLAGRVFTDVETSRAVFNNAAAPTSADPVVIVSHGLWMRRFGGDPGIVGRTLNLERRPFVIVGVMPPGFAAPDAAVQLWIPWHVATDHPRDQHYVGAVARLKAGVPMDRAEAQLNAVAIELEAAYPATNRGWRVRFVRLADEAVGTTGTVLWVLLAAVGLVLLVACANVALLSLIRGLDRGHETAVRVALGASSRRLLREFLLESVLLAVAGGTLGVLITVAGVRVLPSIATDLPRLTEVAFDGRAFAFIVAVTMVSAVLSGLPQAWKRMRATPLVGLTSASRRTTEHRAHHWLRDVIVIAQVALAVILMLSSGLLVRSYRRLQATETGFDPRGVLVLPVFLDNQQYTTGPQTRSYYQALFDRLSSLPGVTAVGGATTVPTSPLGPEFERPVWPNGADDDPAHRVSAAVRMITPGYIRALGLRLTDGRAIDDRDGPDAPRVLMVSNALARRLWPGESAVGKQLVVDYSTAGTYPYEIVGVLGDMRFRGPRSEPLAEIYLPHAQRSYLIMNVVLKADGEPRGLIPSVRAALHEVDPQQPAQGVFALEDLLGATYARDRQAMVTLLLFAGAAIFLAVLGLYGVLSQRVRERAREIGIRMAMGANPLSVVRWVAASGLRLVAIGAIAGTVAAYVMSGTIQGLLFGVAATDSATLVSVLVAVACVGFVASLLPSWRATRIDPVEILRRE